MNEFTLCLNTSTIKPVPLPKKLEIAAEAGFAAIEPWNNEVDEYLADGGTIAELARMIREANLKVVSMIALHSWIEFDGGEHSRAMDECKRRIEQAAALASPTIVASPPKGKVDLNRGADRFAELVELGKSFGVVPSMEFLGFVAGVHTLDQALEIATKGAGPNSFIVADVFHLLRGGGQIDDLLRIKGSRMSCFHINDVPAEPPIQSQDDHDRVMIGEGVADLPQVISNLRKIEYSGPLSLELFNRKLWEEDPLQTARTGIDRIKALLLG